VLKVHHLSIEVSDLERSISFYERFIGFVSEMRMSWEDERIAFLKLGGVRLELVQPETFILKTTNTHIAFEVRDVTNLCDRLLGEGFIFKEEPVISENGWKSVFISGPDGDLVEFLEIAAGDSLVT
jgi:catechol 2,3-dioxygenase-like lactoylglutathione lyase family enzyme